MSDERGLVPNRLRNEVKITLDGQEFILRVTFEVIARIEQTIDGGFYQLTARSAQKDVTITEIARVLYEGIIGYDPDCKLQYGDVGELVVRTCTADAIKALLDFLTVALQGVPKGKKVTALKKGGITKSPLNRICR